MVSELGCPLDPLGLTEHGSWRQEPHSGGLGWGLPCAMGIKLADPDRLVIATIGDGSYMFANPVACHQVAEAHDIAVLTIVLNNAGYGAVRNSVLDLYPTGYAAKDDDVPLTGLSPSPDFAQVAAASRAHAETVRTGASCRPRSSGRCTRHGRTPPGPARCPRRRLTRRWRFAAGSLAGLLAGLLDGHRSASTDSSRSSPHSAA